MVLTKNLNFMGHLSALKWDSKQSTKKGILRIPFLLKKLMSYNVLMRNKEA